MSASAFNVTFKELNKRLFKTKIKELIKLNKTARNTIKVGLPKGSGDYDFNAREAIRTGNQKTTGRKLNNTQKSITLVEIGTINEFGSSDGRIPARSFLRSTVKEKRAKYKALSAKIVEKVIDKPEDFLLLLGKLGQIAENDVKNKIRDLKEPKNAPLTIKLKGSDNPLIDTGQLRQAIRFVIDDKKEKDDTK